MLPFYPFRGRRRQCLILSVAVVCAELCALLIYLTVRVPPTVTEYDHEERSTSLSSNAPDTLATQLGSSASSSPLVPSKTNRFKMVVGILTTLRNPPTVLDVAQRLVHVGNPSDYTFLVWQSYSASGDALTKSNLEQWGFSVTVQRLPYPEVQPDRIRITWNDSMERMQWRTNHGERCNIGVHCSVCHAYLSTVE